MPYQGPQPKPIPADSVDVNSIQQAAVAQALSQARAMIEQAKDEAITVADQKAAAAAQSAVDQAAATTQSAMKSANQNARKMADDAGASSSAQSKSYVDGSIAAMGREVDDSLEDMREQIVGVTSTTRSYTDTVTQDILPSAKKYADDQDKALRAILDSSITGLGSSMQDAISHAQQGAVASAANTSSSLVEASAARLQQQIVDAVNSLKSSAVDPLTSQVTTLQGQAYKIETRDGIQVPAISLLNLSGSQDVTVTWTNAFPDANYTITKPQVSLANVNLIGKVNAEVKSKTKDGCVISVTTTAVLALGTASLSVLAYRKITG